MIAWSRQFVSSFPVSSVLEAIVLGASRALFMRFLSTAKSSSSRTIASLYATGGAEGGGGRAEVRVRLRVWLREQLRMGQHAWLPAQSSFPAEIRLSAPATLPPQVRCPSGCWAGLHPRGSFDSTLSETALGSDLSNSLVPRPNLNHGDHPMRDIAR